MMSKSACQQNLDACKLIATDEFPFEFLSAIAMRESWRKEIYRPIYHLHKWWAKRLGSVFRGMILGCLLPAGADLEKAFYEPHDFSHLSIFDPFMGSGTTIGEGYKLGCTVLGRDINPVACESVRVALGKMDRSEIERTFEQLSVTVGQRIQRLYQTTDENGRACEVLYYFWVKQADCPACTTTIDLFSDYIVARNAYPDRKPEVQVYCPGCGNLFPAFNRDQSICCPACQLKFSPHQAVVDGANATCTICQQTFQIIAALRPAHQPPRHRLYAKLILLPNGEKRYLPTSAADHQAYQDCAEVLKAEIAKGKLHLPETILANGVNTKQAINYQYKQWRDFFNHRQLLALGWLQQAISEITEPSTRDLFLTLLSGLLEFNNVFASYKGEGTGAVRHMFAHHVLKPVRTPIEANVWGTAKSSGSFSNLFKSRVLRALEYRAVPFEVSNDFHRKLNKGQNGSNGKHYQSSRPFSGQVECTWPITGQFAPNTIYLSCGSSDQTALPDASIDLIITDPPFFDNVHYSELADFFFAWQSLYPRGFIQPSATTRHPKEVQDADAFAFATKLQAVFVECQRILKAEGLFVFTYHHSRNEGWTTLLQAIWQAGFSVVNAHPVKAEMSVAVPKAQTKEPIQLDIILVCTKRIQDKRPLVGVTEMVRQAEAKTRLKVSRLQKASLTLSKSDLRIILISQLIVATGPLSSAQSAVEVLHLQQSQLDELIDSLYNETPAPASPAETEQAYPPQGQLAFPFEL